MKKLLLSLLLIIPLIFMSCEKEKVTDKLVNIKVQTEGLMVHEMKSFDINTWIWNYNPNQYTMTMTGQQTGQVYTFEKSITELQNGFSINILPDTYTITYISTHQPESGNLSTTLDITINETKTINSTSQTLSLNATNEDYLIIFDVSFLIQGVYFSNGQTAPFFNNSNDFYWGYNNQIGGDYTFYYITTNGNQVPVTIPNVQKGKVYHIISNIGGDISVSIEQMTEEYIIL